MHMRMLAGVALALALLLGMGACVDDPGQSILGPEGTSLARGGQGNAPTPVRMMSRNLYLGADIDHVLEDPVGGADIAWGEIVYTNYPARAAVLAGEIAARRPHLVGLQEVALYVMRDMNTFEPVFMLDFLEILGAYLAAYGVPYQMVTRSPNFQAILPMGGFYVQYMDGDAILALAGAVEVRDAGWRHFSPANQVNLDDYVPGLGYNFRGFTWADVTVDRQRLLFVNTHLEVQHWADVQERQTAELLGWVNGRRQPTFMVGDFNSAANPNAPERAKTGSYRMILDAGFDDLWLRGRGRFTNDGPTCCQLSNLTNPESVLDERIDFLFARNTPPQNGFAGGAELHIFGHLPSDRFLTTNDLAPELGAYLLWPSDHAGLYGELTLPVGLMR
jgi:endonuclease/exonuclease/phosphatase family metal-dependent hydrolase